VSGPLTDAQIGAMRTLAGVIDGGLYTREQAGHAALAIRMLTDEVARLRGEVAGYFTAVDAARAEEESDDGLSRATLAALDAAEATLRAARPSVALEDLRHENRRLRQILDVVARGGVGTGALVEVYTRGDSFGIAVCRADRDEAAFTRDVMAGLQTLAQVLGSRINEDAPIARTGVTAGDPHQGEVDRG
jgi:hypothetical protein